MIAYLNNSLTTGICTQYTTVWIGMVLLIAGLGQYLLTSTMYMVLASGKNRGSLFKGSIKHVRAGLTVTCQMDIGLNFCLYHGLRYCIGGMHCMA